jgi:hypothetical protein
MNPNIKLAIECLKLDRHKHAPQAALYEKFGEREAVCTNAFNRVQKIEAAIQYLIALDVYVKVSTEAEHD